VLKEIVNEMIELCSKNKPSQCRSGLSETLIKLKMEGKCIEWRNRLPIFYAFLSSAVLPSNHIDAVKYVCLLSIVLAGSVLFCDSCKHMNAMRHLISIIITFSLYQVSIFIFTIITSEN
jgi:hypothetical protein